MKKPKLILFLFPLLALVACHASAQASLSPEVLASAGNTSAAAGGANLSFTVGEVAIQTLTASGVSFGQGFHNGVLDIVGADHEALADWHLRVYPNPASQTVFVEYEAPQPGLVLSATLWDLQGRQLLAPTPLTAFGKNPIQINHLPGGTYLLRLSDQDGRTASVKIVKAN